MALRSVICRFDAVKTNPNFSSYHIIFYYCIIINLRRFLCGLTPSIPAISISQQLFFYVPRHSIFHSLFPSALGFYFFLWVLYWPGLDKEFFSGSLFRVMTCCWVSLNCTVSTCRSNSGMRLPRVLALLLTSKYRVPSTYLGFLYYDTNKALKLMNIGEYMFH